MKSNSDSHLAADCWHAHVLLFHRKTQRNDERTMQGKNRNISICTSFPSACIIHSSLVATPNPNAETTERSNFSTIYALINRPKCACACLPVCGSASCTRFSRRIDRDERAFLSIVSQRPPDTLMNVVRMGNLRASTPLFITRSNQFFFAANCFSAPSNLLLAHYLIYAKFLIDDAVTNVSHQIIINLKAKNCSAEEGTNTEFIRTNSPGDLT